MKRVNNPNRRSLVCSRVSFISTFGKTAARPRSENVVLKVEERSTMDCASGRRLAWFLSPSGLVSWLQPRGASASASASLMLAGARSCVPVLLIQARCCVEPGLRRGCLLEILCASIEHLDRFSGQERPNVQLYLQQ